MRSDPEDETPVLLSARGCRAAPNTFGSALPAFGISGRPLKTGSGSGGLRGTARNVRAFSWTSTLQDSWRSAEPAEAGGSDGSDPKWVGAIVGSSRTELEEVRQDPYINSIISRDQGSSDHLIT